MRVVVDTNCLIASIPHRGKYYWLYQEFHAGKFQWLISNEILSEYLEKLTDFYSAGTAEVVYSILSASPRVTFTEPFFKWKLMHNDPDDNKFADLAIAANADFIVTNDKHFDLLKTIPFPQISVISLNEFKSILCGTT